jgi:hypothetical protein
VPIQSRISAIHPAAAIEGGRITVEGSGFAVDEPRLPDVWVGEARARVVYASPTRLAVIVPPLGESGRATVRIDDVPGLTGEGVGAGSCATGLHPVETRCSTMTATCM